MGALNYQAAIEINAQYTGQGAVNQANNDLNKLGSSSKTLNQELTSLVKGGLAALAAAFTVEKITEFGKALIDLGDHLHDLGQKTGIGVQTLSDLKSAAEKGGLSFEGMEKGLKKFTVTLSAAQAGNEKAQAGFRAIGFSTDDIKNFKSADEALLALAEKFKDTADGADKLKVANLLGGKAFGDFIPLLNEGKDKIKGLGVQISKEFADEADKFNDHMVEMKISAQNFGVSILEKVLPSLNTLIEKLKSTSSQLFSWRDELDKKFFESDFWKSIKSGAQKALNSNIAGAPHFNFETAGGQSLVVGPEKPTGEEPKKNKIDKRFLGDKEDDYKNEANALKKLQEELVATNELYNLQAQSIDLTTSELEKKKIAIDENKKAEKEVAGFQSSALKQAYLETTQKIIEQKQAIVDLKDQQKQSFGNGLKEGLKEYTESVRDVASQSKKLFTDAFKGIEDALVNFAQTGKLNFADLAKSIEADLIRIAVRQAVIAPLLGFASSFFSPAAGAGSAAPAAAGGTGYLGNFHFADGGIMTSRGPVPLRKYAGGGIASSPQLAMFGEGSTPEAYVPVPSGKIPVVMKGGGGTNVVVNVNMGQGGASDTASQTDQGKQLGNAISAAVVTELIKQKRPGGLLA